MNKIYLIRENKITIELLEKVLRKKGYSTFSSGISEALGNNIISEITPDILFWGNDILEAKQTVVFNWICNFTLSCKSVFVLSNSTLPILGFGLINGIEGFVHKAGGISDLENCLEALCMGNTYLSPFLSGSLTNGNKVKQREKNSITPSLTHQERKILLLVNKKMTSKEIGKELNISFKTVQNHRHNICKKLGLKGRNKLFEFANAYFS